MSADGRFPEHEKMAKITDKSQAIGEFLTWLGDEKSIYLTDHSDYRLEGIPVQWGPLLYEFFEIDPVKIETEKRAMLDEMRATFAEAEVKHEEDTPDA
jgi:hypothetical protein